MFEIDRMSRYIIFEMYRIHCNSKEDKIYGFYDHVIAEIIKYTIKKISEIRYNIVSVNCDQGSNNRSADLGATTEQPYFMLGNKKIFLLYDVPYLFKSVRNRLQTADIYQYQKMK